jgi:hypothetical protein
VTPSSWSSALRREVGAGAAGTCGAPGAALRREVGTRATPGPAPILEVGVGATRTRGGLGAALRREVGVGAVATLAGPEAVLIQEVGAGSAGTHGGPRAALSREPGTTPPPPPPRPSVRGQGVVVPVMPLDNPHRMITRGKTDFKVVPDRLVLTAATSSPTLSPIPSSAHAVLVDPHWRAAMEDEYGALISNGTWELVPDLRTPTLSPASGSSHTSSVLTGPLIAKRPVGSFRVSLSAPESTMTRPSARL